MKINWAIQVRLLHILKCSGLALSLESESAGVWLNTGATALHKFVISFSVGVELISNKVSFFVIRITFFSNCFSLQVSMMMFSISIIVFSFAPAVGSAIGRLQLFY